MKTLRLLNMTASQLSCNLQRVSGAATGRLRRGVVLTPILIAPHNYYDMCSALSLSYQDAVALMSGSPEVQAFIASGRLQALDFPPPPMPPPPPPPVVEVVAAEVEVVDVPETPAPAEEPAPEAPVLVFAEEPSMDWPENKLRDYARARNIDVSQCKSKTAMLKRIRSY